MRSTLLVAFISFSMAACAPTLDQSPPITPKKENLIVRSQAHYWGPELGSPPLRLENDPSVSGQLRLRVCKGVGNFKYSPFDLRVMSYDPSVPQKSEVMFFPGIIPDSKEPSCTIWVSIALSTPGLEATKWIKAQLTSPSGPRYNNCADEALCARGMGVKDNTYDTTAHPVLGNNGDSITFGKAHYWGPELGSPPLRLETDASINGELKLRVCKGVGVFKYNPFDLAILSYDPSISQKNEVMFFPRITPDAKEPSCTIWVSIAVSKPGLEPAKWIKGQLTSPSGPRYNNCADEALCAPGMGVKDNTYDTPSLEILGIQ